MADVKDQRTLNGFSGQIGQNLSLEDMADGRQEVKAALRADEEEPNPAWEAFREAVTYARRAQHREEYLEVARRRNATPMEVATADFLHAPEIHRIDLSAYHGRPGDPIRIFATDDFEVASVGVLITDEENLLVEMGMADRGDGKDEWVYLATRDAPSDHVRVIVDAADLPGHLTEGRAEKDV